MNVLVDVSSNKVIPRMMAALGAEGRSELYAVAVEDLANFITAHIASYAPSKHRTAHAFGAQPTGHYEKGMAAIGTSASADEGTVTIPIPGISRAWGAIEITPRRANRLTVPLSSAGETVYGKTVVELREHGWKFFQGQKGHDAEDILFGYRGKGKDRETKAMFVLKTVVALDQDASLLPSKEAISKRAANAMVRRIMDVVRKARTEMEKTA